jgi:hypothetical protein
MLVERKLALFPVEIRERKGNVKPEVLTEHPV